MHSEVELVLRADFLSAVELQIGLIGSRQVRIDTALESLLTRTSHMRVLKLITVDEASEIKQRANAALLGQ